MAEDTLEALFRQFEEETAAFEQEYGDWLSGDRKPAVSGAGMTARPAVTAAAPVPTPAVSRPPQPDKKETPPADLRNMQLYALRRRYGTARTDPRLECSNVSLPGRKETPLTANDSGELYMQAQTALADGRQNEEAGAAVRALYRNKNADPFRRNFLYIFTTLQQPLSLQILEEMMGALPARPGRENPGQAALAALREAVEYVYDVNRQLQQMKTKGLRDRQQALETARRQAQQRYAQARAEAGQGI